jgi:hypothetical protein
MKYISQTMDRMNLEEGTKSDDMSIVEKIIHKTSNPKIAAVLALDLLLVGVDTVSWPNRDCEQTAASADIWGPSREGFDCWLLGCSNVYRGSLTSYG